MAQITAAMVKELRERTSVGMMECKKALVEADGDMEKAVEALRKAGQAKADKKGDRTAAEGMVSIAVSDDNRCAALVEVNCETDFVAMGDQFKDFTKQVANAALQNECKDVDALSQQKIGGKTVDETRKELITTLGENIAVRRVTFMQVAEGVVGTYLHGGSGAARIGSMVSLDTDNKALAVDMAMQVAAMKPDYLDEAAVPADRIAKEKEIFMAQARENNAGKPDDILEKIITGKLKKLLKEITLVGQAFVKDSDQTIEKVLKAAKANVTSYARYEVGEGIEKKADDFVGEVMAQANKE